MERHPIIVQPVSEISDAAKSWLETVTGQPLLKQQHVAVMVFTPGVLPNESGRLEALQAVKRTWSAVEEHCTAHGINHEEFDNAVDEAMKAARRGD